MARDTRSKLGHRIKKGKKIRALRDPQEAPLPGEKYPTRCSSCGEKATQDGGCVDHFTKDNGPRREHFACFVVQKGTA